MTCRIVERRHTSNICFYTWHSYGSLNMKQRMTVTISLQILQYTHSSRTTITGWKSPNYYNPQINPFFGTSQYTHRSTEAEAMLSHFSACALGKSRWQFHTSSTLVTMITLWSHRYINNAPSKPNIHQCYHSDVMTSAMS